MFDKLKSKKILDEHEVYSQAPFLLRDVASKTDIGNDSMISVDLESRAMLKKMIY